MAEEKKDAKKDGSGDDWVIAYLPLVVLGVLLLMGAWLGGTPIFGNLDGEPAPQRQSSDKSIFSPYRLVGSGEMSEGARIINMEDVPVRTVPAGGIIGRQEKLETGFLRGEPAEAYGTVWWRVDYPEAPDGWVNAEQVTTKIGFVRTLNIVPILYGFYKPIGYTLLFVLLILYLYFYFMLKKEEGISEKKKKLKDELYKEKVPSLAEQISAKPDAQEVPGLQTEEIVPIQVLEKNARWQHIQDLLKSYNVNDWRQAILEADIILEEMLDKMQYEGISIGDKLKKVEKSDFVTLDRAWAAHRVRNQIAHEGASFKLHREQAEKTIRDYEEVFREFYYI